MNAIIVAFLVACGSGSSGPDSGQVSDSGAGADAPESTGAGDFRFVVFGDFNGGGCDRNARVANIVESMSSERDIAFFISTGDLIDGYGQGDDSTSCFASDPSSSSSFRTVCSPEGNMSQIMSAIKDRPALPGLAASFYPVIGNHDDNWGSDWYPDPCGDGICDFLAPLTPEAYINHAHGDICSKNADNSAHSEDFYYSFSYQNSYFIVLRINNDYDTLLSACNTNPGHADCVSYCSDVSLFDDDTRNDSCWGDGGQYEWFLSELEKSKMFDNVFVFSHAVALAGGDGHVPFTGSEKIREVAEAAGVDIYFNGHNHAYHRSNSIRGAELDSTGTMYITTGVSGATIDDTTSDWYTARTVNDWTDPGRGDLEAQNSAYIVVTVRDAVISGEVFSPFVQATSVDSFSL